MCQPDSVFDAGEPLYRRLDPHWYDERFVEADKVPLAAIPFPDFSVNRGKYSEPDDVLGPGQASWGIASFQVKHVPPEIPHPANSDVRYSFAVEHVPEEENYAHSEIRTYKNGARLGTDPNGARRIAGTVKAEFRAKLRRHLTVVKAPDLGYGYSS